MEERKPRSRKEAIAIGLLFKQPDWTNAQIAAAVPCAHTSLTRMLVFRYLRVTIRESGRAEMPKGSKFRDKDNPDKPPTLEAWHAPPEEEE